MVTPLVYYLHCYIYWSSVSHWYLFQRYRMFWSSPESQLAYGIWYFIFFYIIMLAIFVYCYVHILLIIRRQVSVMAAHAGTGSNARQVKASQMQSNIVKTMILVSAWYAVSDLPMNVYYLMLNIHRNLTIIGIGYYTSLFISFLYICTNPFIYAAKFEPVKRAILRLIPSWKKTTEPETESIEISGSVTTRAIQ